MRRLVIAAAAAGLLVVGCSKSSDTSTGASSTTAAPAATEAPATTPATTKPKTSGTTPGTVKRTTTTLDDEGSTTTVAGGANPDSAYCTKAASVAEIFAQGNELDPTSDPAGFIAFLDDAATSAEELVDEAPAEIQADWQTIADTFGQLAQSKPDDLMTNLGTMGTDVEQAGEHIDEVTQAECGFKMGEGGSESSEPQTGTAEEPAASSSSTEK